MRLDQCTRMQHHAAELIVPKRLWDRANALDSMAYAVTGAAGPALAGAFTAWLGPQFALGITAALYVAAALPMVGLAEPMARGGSGSVLQDATDGLLYVVRRNASLRGLAIVISLVNVGFGILIVALPVMVFQRLHGDAAMVGGLWALLGIGSALSVLFFGRLNSEGRERLMIGVATLGGSLGIAVLAVTGNVLLAAAAVGFVGLSNGPADIALFSMRLIHLGLTFAIAVSAGFLLLAAVLVPLVIPPGYAGTMVPESARQSRRDRPVEESPSSAEQGAG